MRVSRQATVGWGVVQLARRAWRAVDGSLRARRRPRRAVVCVRRGPRRLPARHVDAARWRARRLDRHDRRAGRDDRRSGGGRTVAFTWYVFIGAATTCVVAWVLSRLARGTRGRQIVTRFDHAAKRVLSRSPDRPVPSPRSPRKSAAPGSRGGHMLTDGSRPPTIASAASAHARSSILRRSRRCWRRRRSATATCRHGPIATRHSCRIAGAGVEGRGSPGVTVRDCFEHSSGLPAHRPYFETLSAAAPHTKRQSPGSHWSTRRERAELYSDLGLHPARVHRRRHRRRGPRRPVS